MNHFVPDFDTDDDYVNINNNNTNSLNLPTTKPITGQDDNDLMELLWENGQVVVQNQRLKKPSSSPREAAPSQPQPQPCSDQNLFIQEDEMTSWLHCPLREDDFCSDLLFSASTATPAAPSAPATQVTAARPPAPTTIETRPPVRNFMNFSRLRGNFGRGESGPRAIVRESTQVNPSTRQSSAASNSGLTRRTDEIESRDYGSFAGLDRKGKAVAEIPGTSTSKEPDKTILVDERKRKERDESEETKQGRGQTTSNKRSRAAEVHNLSERKRRDRINERMKALQELIPRCNKSDKASMLDEAIEYMKSLQLQIQMMSVGCGMMPMMYPYMAMGMGMGMGMNQPPPPPPFLPFPNMLPAQRPLPTGTASLFPGPHFPPHASDPSRPYLTNQQPDQPSTQHQFPPFTDPYQQFRNLHPAQPPHFQNQATSYPSSSRVSSSKDSEDQGNHTTG